MVLAAVLVEFAAADRLQHADRGHKHFRDQPATQRIRHRGDDGRVINLVRETPA